jgi:methylthioribulose-1-phosphate dehydratase
MDVFATRADSLAALSRHAAARGWALGTSGNFSAVVSLQPLRLAITPSGADKAALSAEAILEIDERGKPVRGSGRPSAETPLHLAVVLARGAGAVAHTHSVWSTILSEQRAGEGGLFLEGYEMLKGLRGVTNHTHREWVPIVENTQDWAAERPAVERLLRENDFAHGFLIRAHGLYTWGEDIQEARRHLEILEFLLEVEGRRR